MTGPEYAAALTTLGLTYETAATWLGIGRSTSHRYTQVGCEDRTVIKLLEVALAVKGLERFYVGPWDSYSVKEFYRTDGQWVRHSDLTAAVGL